jgi:hypothetical protein
MKGSALGHALQDTDLGGTDISFRIVSRAGSCP